MSWKKSYSQTVTDVDPARIWNVWTDVDQWHTWQDDVQFAQLHGPFESGAVVTFKPKAGPTLKLHVLRVDAGRSFVDVTHLPLARLYDMHEIIHRAHGVAIKTTITVEGILAFLWRRLIAERIVEGLRAQTDRLVARVRAVS